MTAIRARLRPAAALAVLLLGPGPAAARPEPGEPAGSGRTIDRDAPKIELTRDDVRRWLPVDPRALAAPVAEMRLLAAEVAAGTTDARLLRAYWRLQSRLYPYDFTPTPLAVALGQKKALEARPAEATPPPVDGCWFPMGPRNLPGRMTGLALHPTDPRTVFAGGADGGLWKTSDLGATWFPLTDFEPTLAVGALAIDPTDPRVLYIGTGEGNYSGDSLGGMGLMKSIDGGATWRLLPFPADRFHELRVDPRDTSRLWAASTGGLFRSTDGGASWAAAGGGLPQEDTTSVVLSAKPPFNVLLAGVGGGFGRSAARGLYRSTDGGSTWALVPSFPSGGDNGRLVIAQSGADPDRWYAAVASTTSGDAKGIYRSDDQGATWTQVSRPASTCATYCWYCLTIAADAGDRDLAYVGGVHLYKTSDAGGTWTLAANQAPGTYVHVDHHVFLSPAAGTLWSANDGGLAVTRDRGGSWDAVGLGLETLQYYHLTTDRTDDSWAIGGSQDNGTSLFTGSQQWRSVMGGDGAFTAIDWVDPNVVYASWQFLNLARSRSRGSGFVAIGAGIDRRDRIGFIAPYILDRSNPTTVLAGTERLYRSLDQGDSFTALSPSLGPGELAAIDNCRDVPGVIWAGTNQGKLWNTADDGQSWQDRSAGLPDRAITSISAHPSLPGTAWVTVGGTGVGHVWRTDDFGATWIDRTGGLPDVHFNRVLVLEDQPNVVVAAADLGVYRSDNGGIDWMVYGSELPNVAVDWIDYSPVTGALRAATHGRGAWQLVLRNDCPLAPAFAGLGSASLVATASGCAIDLAWPAATASCPAFASLRYNVYRSTSPGFRPGPATLLASGITGLGYQDRSARFGQVYFYLVRVEDNQTGRGGPANDGREDNNREERYAEVGDPVAGGGLSDDGGDNHAWLASTGWSVSALANSTPGGRHAYLSAPGGASSYLPDACIALTTPPLRLGPGASLGYQASYNLEDEWDGVVVEISTDGGNNWSDLPPAGGYPRSFAQTQGNGCGFAASRAAFSGPPGNGARSQFQNYVSDLSAWAGQTVQVRWVFSADGGLEYDGFFLDDVTIGPATGLGPVCPACNPGGPRVTGNSLRLTRLGPAGTEFSWASPDPPGEWNLHRTDSKSALPNLWADDPSRVARAAAAGWIDAGGGLGAGLYRVFGRDGCSGSSLP